MSIEENRNCSCNDDMDNNMMNSNMNMMSNMNTMPEMTNIQGKAIDCCEKEEMLQQIRCCDFAINELALY